MYHLAKPLFLHCETPLHAGSGSELGVIDLPIQRERHTHFPKIEGSSLKGAIRERAEQVYIQAGKKRDHNDLFVTFGPEGEENYAGALGFTDARLLLFPVKSMKGVFAWVTCPQVIKRFLQDLATCELELPLSEQDLPEPVLGEASVSPNSALVLAQNSIILEEYAFAVKPKEELSTLGEWLSEQLFPSNGWWKDKIQKSLVLLNDEDFRDFANLATEVITRTKINNETGTVADGALFTEEYLPAESILYSLVLAAPVFPVGDTTKNKLSKKDSWEESDALAVMDFFEQLLSEKAQNRLQVGANATLGKGLIRTTLLK